jgi:hypothetical protein
MSKSTVVACTPLNDKFESTQKITPEWPQVWVGRPTGEDDSGSYWNATIYSQTGVWMRWSEDGEIWFHDPRFEDPIDVSTVSPNAVQVSGTTEV